MREGTIATRLRSPRLGGFTDPLPLRFPQVSLGAARLTVYKNPDSSLHVELVGPEAGAVTFRTPLPAYTRDELHLAVTWKPNEVTLYLDGRCVDSRKVMN